jgi:hypothetical protein
MKRHTAQLLRKSRLLTPHSSEGPCCHLPQRMQTHPVSPEHHSATTPPADPCKHAAVALMLSTEAFSPKLRPTTPSRRNKKKQCEAQEHNDCFHFLSAHQQATTHSEPTLALLLLTLRLGTRPLCSSADCLSFCFSFAYIHAASITTC